MGKIEIFRVPEESPSLVVNVDTAERHWHRVIQNIFIVVAVKDQQSFSDKLLLREEDIPIIQSGVLVELIIWVNLPVDTRPQGGWQNSCSSGKNSEVLHVV